MKKYYFLPLCILLSLFFLNHSEVIAQQNTDYYQTLVNQEFQRIQAENQLADFLTDTEVSSISYSAGTERTLVYIRHTINGVPIDGAVSIMAFDKKDDLKYERISKRIDLKKSTQPAADFRLNQQQAEDEALLFLSKRKNTILENAPSFVKEPIKTQKIYYPQNNDYVPAYKIEVFINLEQVELITIDAITGEVLDAFNMVLNCSFDTPTQAGSINTESDDTAGMAVDSFMYNVAALPEENIIANGRELIPSPADSLASKIGWHNVAEYMPGKPNILEGNNIRVYLDRNGDMIKDDTIFPNADGNFDFPLDLSKEPEAYYETSMTQLFVTNNQIHDILYHNYFDEEAGNYQVVNFESDRPAEDPVIVFGQSQAGVPGGARNNAIFYPSADGNVGWMMMYIWGFETEEGLTVIKPEEIEGTYTISESTFAPGVSDNPVEGYVTLVDDGQGNPADGCETLLNAEEIEGKIALIDRGECPFSEKALRAEQAGAIAVIIVNLDGNDVLTMDGDDMVNIPVIMVGRDDGNLLKEHIDELYVSLGPDSTSGPNYRDGALDNTVPIHEYGHGISNRLIGGPDNVYCMQNDEQMGEGWSDILALILTMNESNYTVESRHMGAYAYTGTTNEGGIRNKIYSPDMSINSYTYKDIFYTGGSPHNLGEVWATFLWDMTRALVDLEGFDPDLINGEGGNRIALQLIVEGLKYTECSPGFIDGRDGILAADEALFNGKYSCLIWNVFARRGVGYYAMQENTDNRTTGLEEFSPNPYCDARIKVDKIVPEYAQPGDTVEVELLVFNHTDSSSGEITLLDSIPVNAEFIASSGEYELDYENSGRLSSTIDNIAVDDTLLYTYTYRLNNVENSIYHWDNHFEARDSFDNYFSANNLTGSLMVRWDPDIGKDSTGAILIQGNNTSEQVVEFNEAIHVEGDLPVIVIEHNYEIEAFRSGGYIEYSFDGENWDIVDSALVTGPYDLKVRGNNIPDHYRFAYSGDSDWRKTAIDMSPWIGNNVYLRFRFITSVFGREYWRVNSISFIDALAHNTEVCIETENSGSCYSAPGLGTIVMGKIVTDTVSTHNPYMTDEIKIHPQPFNDVFTMEIPEEILNEVQSMKIYDNEGHMIYHVKNNDILQKSIDASEWTPGIYYLQIDSKESRMTKKLLKQ